MGGYVKKYLLQRIPADPRLLAIEEFGNGRLGFWLPQCASTLQSAIKTPPALGPQRKEPNK
jgi:hypothetical protein